MRQGGQRNRWGNAARQGNQIGALDRTWCPQNTCLVLDVYSHITWLIPRPPSRENRGHCKTVMTVREKWVRGGPGRRGGGDRFERRH